MPEFSRPQKYKAACIEKTQLTEKVFFARYQLVEPSAITFIAGQTFMLTVAPGVFRAMSIASPPQERTVISSIQDVAPGGPGSKWMEALKVGDPVEFMAPLGRFVIDHDSPRRRVMVATGTGFAPFRSMLLDSSNGLTGQQEVCLYWGLRFEEDVYLLPELKQLGDIHPNFRYHITLSRPGTSWQGLNGHVTDHVFALEKDPAGCDYYLCGNKSMISEMEEKLGACHVQKEQMKFDPFF